jgi:ubiquinone/menaquinone biosynthesis C-methylase UbiE
MGFWSDSILPRMIDRGMRNDFMAEHRYRAAPLASGRVLEIGSGSGLNLPLYTDQVEHVFGLEPSEYLREKAQEFVPAAPFPVDFIDASAEAIPLERDSVDTVVSSWTLCSIPDIETTLQEIRRVLRADGRFIFIEHGRSPDEKVRRWQDRLVPVSTRLLGCSLNRPMDLLIEEAGFRLTEIEAGYLKGPKLISYHYIGQALPA